MLRDLFRPRTVAMSIHLDVVQAHKVQAGDVLFVGIPTDWSPTMIEQFTAYAEQFMAERIPSGVKLVFVPGQPVVLHGLLSQRVDRQREADNGQ